MFSKNVLSSLFLFFIRSCACSRSCIVVMTSRFGGCLIASWFPSYDSICSIVSVSFSSCACIDWYVMLVLKLLLCIHIFPEFSAGINSCVYSTFLSAAYISAVNFALYSPLFLIIEFLIALPMSVYVGSDACIRSMSSRLM